MGKMKLLEEYEELIERDPAQISILWKVIQIFLYFLGAISGYCCAIIFYIFWVDIFGGHCPLWAHAYMKSKTVAVALDHYKNYEKIEFMQKAIESDYENLLNYIIVRYDYERNCEVYYLVSLCSCIFGIVWIALFSICGKGGYDTRIMIAPWRIVMPALSFNLIFTMVTTYAVHNLEAGFTKFKFDIQKLFSDLTDNELILNQMVCNILQKHVEIYNVKRYDICSLFVVLKILTWLMAWSWTIGLIVLIIRILIIVDFRLLKVMIYEIPYNSIALLADSNIDYTNTQSESGKEKES